MSEEFWKQEEELDKKFEEEVYIELDDIEELHCDEKCVNCIGGVCVTSDWSCRNMLDRKQMKFN